MPVGFRILPRAPSADTALLERLRKLPVSNVSDNLQRHIGARLAPFHRTGTLVGTAFTVKTRPGDNLMVHKAIDIAERGDVLVIDAGGALDHAIIGELMAGWARKRGIAGFVIDGAIRDSNELSQGDYPVYAAGVTHRGPYKDGPGAINVPVSVGGMSVLPGDIVVGDQDGIVAIAPEEVDTVIAGALKQHAAEEATIQAIREGRWDRSFVDDLESRCKN